MRPQTKERWLTLLIQFQRSQLTFDQFAAKHEVNSHTLKKYYYQLRSELPQQNAFLPVLISETNIDQRETDQQFSLHVNSQGELHFASLPSPDYLAQLVRSLRQEAS